MDVASFHYWCMVSKGTLNTPGAAPTRFQALSYADQATAIRKMAADGQSEATIAEATGISPKAVSAVLAYQVRE
jgi:hypothetical protein